MTKESCFNLSDRLIEEQNKFAQRITKILQFESGYFSSSKKLDELFASLQQKAFSGELSGAAA